MCDGVARHGRVWKAAFIIPKRVAMRKSLSDTYARRVRLSMYAIAAAVALTLAAFVAMSISGGERGLVDAKFETRPSQPTSTH